MSHIELTIVFVCYFIIIYIIGFVATKRTKNVAGYLLGNRSFNPYVTALAAGASDMSGWLLLAMPGAFYLYGLSQIWMPIGLLIGAYLNWRFVAKRLRIASYKAHALTIPEYLRVRFHDRQDIIGLTIAVASLLFFSIYTASGFVAFSLLLAKFYGLSYLHALGISILLTTVYVMIGGFVAVNWVDVFQGTLVLFALLILPSMMFLHLNSLHSFSDLVMEHHAYFNPIHHLTSIGIFSLLGWGLGYFGQPHILVRFMSAKTPESIKTARRIGMSWMFLCLLGGMFVGVFGAIIFRHPALTHPEQVFIVGSEFFYTPIIAGVLLSAVISAVMSTISALMLISSSALVEDIFLKLWPRKIPEKYHLRLDKAGVLLVAIFAGIIAINPKNTILQLVAYAWAGLGSTLGPAMLFSLYWKRATKPGIIAGIVTGALVTIIWPKLAHFGGVFELYSIIPGFFASVTMIYLISLMTRPPEHLEHFNFDD